MNWYKLVFKQNQPIRISSAKWGVINETEIFIPGWTMWGALTKAFNVLNKKDLSNNQDLFENITCFYPFFEKNNGHILFPQYLNGNFMLGNKSEDEFKFDFLDTITSTAIISEHRRAKDESLHELEFLLPKSKNESEIGGLYWVGLVGFNGNTHITNFLTIGLKIYVGADSRYGFGELELIEFDQANKDYLQKYQIDEEGYFSAGNNEPLVNYLEFSNNLTFEGELLLLAEFDFRQNIPKVTEARYFINVGSKIKIENIDPKNYKLKKGKFIKSGG